MAVVVESSATAAYASGNSVTITKPTGLAAGDVLLAQIVTCSGATTTTPSGWTQISADAVSSSAGNITQTFLKKVADSTDVAASDFTFSLSGSVPRAGGLLRISGAGFTTARTTNTQTNDGTTTPLTTGTITPTRAGSLIILAVAGGEFTGAASNYSGYTIATDDPTWAEQWEIDDTTDDYSCALATAVRTETSATGTGSITLGSSGSANDYVVSMVTLTSPLNQSHSPSSLVAQFTIPNQVPGLVSTFNIPAPTVTNTNYQAWVNESKTADGSITNETKTLQ